MTWLSRLLPNGRSSLLRATKRRRRMMSLEALEHRIVLSNVTVSFLEPTSALTIMGDTFNDNFTIKENANGTVTVAPGTFVVHPGLGVVPPSTIDGGSTPFTTGNAVTSITVNLPGTANFDFVTLSGQGKTTPTTVKNVTVTATGANLTFAVNNVDNSGNFVLSDTFASPLMDAALTATVDNSSFATLSITQSGCCAASVELGNDNIPASLSVSEGNGNGDSITVDNDDAFGTTTLLQGNGGPAAYVGNSDTVSVSNASVKDLTIEQLLNGTNNHITVNTLSIAPTSFGVTTSQGNGAGDTTAITLVTTPTPPNPSLPLGTGPPSIIVVQDNGSGDSTRVTNSTLPGSISITQTDVAGNALGDSATISGDKVGYTETSGKNVIAAFPGNLTISQGNASIDTAAVSGSTAVGGNVYISQGNGGGTVTSPPADSATVTGVTAGTLLSNGTVVGGNITIIQGTGSGDSATMSGSTALGDITITQTDVAGNATGDRASVLGVTAGTTIPASPYVIDVNGTVTITQGNAPGDVALLNGDHINNVAITQGDNVQVLNGSTVASDVAEINGTIVTSNISISQGIVSSTAPDAGNYVAAISFDYLGYIKGSPASSSVTASGDTYILQHDANNQVYLGDAGSSFTTVYLDVFTGFGGGAFVMARNMTVDFGSLFGIYTIDGGGSGNTFFDGGGNSGVTVDPANFNFSTLLTPVLTWADPADITYGTALGGTQLDATASVPGSFIYTPAAGTVLSAGANETLSVTFTPTDTTDYGPVTATAMINVNRAALLITANSATRVYGQQNPAFTVTYAGLTNGDSPSSLGGSLHFSTAATASSPVNTYSVVPGGLTSANYAITFAGAKLVVAPASLTITANNQSRVFGQPNPPLTVYYQGFVNGDTPASLTAPVVLSTPAVLASFAGSYPIFVGGAASPNYAIRLVSGTLAVMPPTDPVVLGHIAFVTSLDRDLLLRSPGPADLFSWLQQLNTGRSALHVASAINQLPERRAVLRSHHGVGISFAVALERAVKAQQHAIQNARRALK